MTLDKSGLSKALLAMMNDAQDNSWSKQQVADAMAAAIDGYVRTASVSGVVVALPGGGTASQSSTVGLA
jgi:hypothetical protein